MKRKTPVLLLLVRIWVECILISKGVIILGPVYNMTNPVTGTTFLVPTESSNEVKVFAEARAICRQIDKMADLTDVADASDHHTVLQLMQNADVQSGKHWLGIHDIMSEMVFHSLRTGKPLVYSAFPDGKPTEDFSKNCAVRDRSNQEWLEEKCDGGSDYGALCSIAANPIQESCLFPSIPYEGLCYDFHLLRTVGFTEARHECEAQGHGRMVVPYSLNEARFLQLHAQLAGLDAFWLGIWDNSTDEVYMGMYETATPYFKWGASEPIANSGNVGCVAMVTVDGTYEIHDCTSTKGIVCRLDPGVRSAGTMHCRKLALALRELCLLSPHKRTTRADGHPTFSGCDTATQPSNEQRRILTIMLPCPSLKILFLRTKKKKALNGPRETLRRPLGGGRVCFPHPMGHACFKVLTTLA